MALGTTIGFLGGGNMAEALVKGLLRARVAEAREIVCSDRAEERGALLTQRHGVRFTTSNAEVVRVAEVLVLAVKPQVLGAVLDEVGAGIDAGKLLVSIAAGVPLAAIERRVARGARVIRTMPNTPALVGAGATALVAGAHATAQDLARARALFEAVGRTVVVDEAQLDAVTGLSGSGPAYVYLVIEALADAGVRAGLPRATAQALAAQTVLGSAQLVLESGEHPARLKDQVTSPGGTTIAGVYALEAAGVRAGLMDAVDAATRRSRELGALFLAADER